MNYQSLLIALLLVLPLPGWQESDKPSPIPSKSRRSSSGTRTAEKTNPVAASQERANTKPETNRTPRGDGMSEQTGKACFFSSKVNGAATASGKSLNSEELVAAHASYPIGSRVRITNLANGKTAEVTIVDRIPATQRIINVSEAAARLLDFVKAGTADVRLDLVHQSDATRDRR